PRTLQALCSVGGTIPVVPALRAKSETCPQRCVTEDSQLGEIVKAGEAAPGRVGEGVLAADFAEGDTRRKQGREETLAGRARHARRRSRGRHRGWVYWRGPRGPWGSHGPGKRLGQLHPRGCRRGSAPGPGGARFALAPPEAEGGGRIAGLGP